MKRSLSSTRRIFLKTGGVAAAALLAPGAIAETQHTPATVTRQSLFFRFTDRTKGGSWARAVQECEILYPAMHR
jgi:hypothetical protein